MDEQTDEETKSKEKGTNEWTKNLICQEQFGQ